MLSTMSASPTVLTHRILVLDEANNQNRHVEVKMEEGYSTNLPIDNYDASTTFSFNNGSSSNNASTERFIRVRGDDGITKYIRATPLGLVNSNQQKPPRSNPTSTIRLVPVRTNYSMKSYGSEAARSKAPSESDTQSTYTEQTRTKTENFANSPQLTPATRTSDFGLISNGTNSNAITKNNYSFLTRSYNNNSLRSIRPSGWNITSNNFSRAGTSFLRGTAQTIPVSTSLSAYRYQPSLNRNSSSYRSVFSRGPRTTPYSYMNSSYGIRRNCRGMGYLNFEETEERAISEAIAREEELMRMEDDLRRGGSKIDIDLDYQRIEEEILRREAVARQELEQKRLSTLTNYPSPFSSSRRNQSNLDLMTQAKIKEFLSTPTNLEPKLTDTEDEKDCRLLLNSMVQNVCQWDKQYGWHKAILRKLRDKRINFQMESTISPNNISSFRKVPRSAEVLLNEHMERLKKEIIKRRLNLLKEAEAELEVEFPPTPKQRRKRAPKTTTDENIFKQNPADNLDATVFTLKEEAIENILATSLDDAKQNPLDLFADLITQIQPFDDMMNMDHQLQTETSKAPEPETKSNQSAHNQQKSTPKKMEAKVGSPTKTKAKTKEAKAKGETKDNETQKRATKRNKKAVESAGDCAVKPKRGRPSKAKSVESSTTGTEPSLSPKSNEVDPNRQYCFCNKPYDPKKFYLSCDKCHNLFHSKCLGLTKKKASQLESWVCSECAKKESEAKERLYCLCQKPYDETKFYVGCDVCEDWFHPACVNTSQKVVENAVEYICPRCRVKQRIAEERSQSKMQQRPPSALSVLDPLSLIPNQPLSREDYILLWRMWEMLQLHPQSWPFREPVDLSQHPNYTKIIQKQMDLPRVRAKLEKREYKMAKDFASDVCLMLENARAYHRKYNKSPQILKCADDLENYFYENLSNIKDEMRNKAARRVSECLTYASSLDIDPEQLIGFGSDACLDPAILQKLL